MDKVRILGVFPSYARALMHELRRADAVHVRCPANISLLAVVLLALLRRPGYRWIKYAGNWQAYEGESWSYAFQRWWLKKGFARAEVTINGHWPEQPAHVHTFLNPCLTEEELMIGQQAAEKKLLTVPVRLLFVGQLVKEKGVYRVLDVMAALQAQNIPARLDLVGDGPERQALEQQATALGVRDTMQFHGWLPRGDLGSYYSTAHLMLLPSRSEGWPKVLSEAMAYGVVPLASRVSSIPQYLETFETGRAIEMQDAEGYAEAIAWYIAHPDCWKEESQHGIDAARRFSYTQYLQAVQRLFARQSPNDGFVSTMDEPLWAEALGEQA
jgi:glycosyltransferase involved in cell wall biosynthesis